jgi:hypothetical protein
MDPRTRSSGSPLRQVQTDTFGSLSLGQAYIDSVGENIGSLGGGELIDALERLDRACDEFPELELDRPRREVLAGLQSTAETLPDRVAIPLLMYCAAAGTPLDNFGQKVD